MPVYEIISVALAFAAMLLIIPGFATDFIGFNDLSTNKEIDFEQVSKQYSNEKLNEDFIEGESEDIDDKK